MEIVEQNVNEIIGSFNEYLEKIPNGCAVIADLFRQDQYIVGIENMSNFIEGLDWVINVTEFLKQKNFEVEINLEIMNPFLLEINEAIAVEDYNLVADIFEYELVDFFRNIRKIELSK